MGPALRDAVALRGRLDGNGMSIEKKGKLDWAKVDKLLLHDQRWVTQAQASRICGRSRQWVNQKILNGKIVNQKFDDQTFVALPSLVLYMVEVESDQIANEFEEFLYKHIKRYENFFEGITTKDIVLRAGRERINKPHE